MGSTIQHEKLDQAISILNERNMDCWLTFVRESAETSDPALKLINAQDVTWQSAFIVTRGGQRIAIVGAGDGTLIRQAGLFPDVRTYDQGIAPVLRQTLAELDPRQVAINYSASDYASDGITHGMYLALRQALVRTPYLHRLESAAPIIMALRSRKSPTELSRMRRAIAMTEEIFALVEAALAPGRTERQVADMVHGELRERGLRTSWPLEDCPIVNAGANSQEGHAGPTDLAMQPGDLIHLDFGVRDEGYCADLQRMWYLRGKGEDREPPANVTRAFAACVAAIEAGRKRLRATVRGWEVDAAARESLQRAGYPEYMHALGHSVGLACHDGGALLGPRWARYGDTPERPIEVDSVYTLELGTRTERGYIGLEDEVLVSARGAEFISPAQRELRCVG
ncbi:MAG TPA: Xaa-Pro peptidase family protein [Ktedonobacterales bacterium]|nr:Xaa-Pro peptidase family protein [Ktedonobacterales bacterium]